MEFWGVEVKAGQPLKVKPEDEEIIHISLATLGESEKKGVESVPIYVKSGNKKLVLGTLSANKFPQISYDLVFEKEFELSHNWKDCETDSEEEDNLLINLEANGNVDPGHLNVKKALGNAKAAKVKSEEKPKVNTKAEKSNIKDSDSDEDDDDESADDDSDEDGSDSDVDSDDDDDEDDSDEDEQEETPKKADAAKKRSIDSAAKTPEAKKTKFTTPQKTVGKKGGQTATPHPAKQGAKNPASDKKQQQTQKSGGPLSCGSCCKTFTSGNALQSHTKAKHDRK
ncbi:hypothetical protein SAY87_005466 [Trapa incisa]|uniref:C2H2-type domain-containing protein n=1 Tax=Trapa incisa TaxID=236973 RepID=A0AAN7K2Z3_9MYRT|nr:hypothetical protein SAY87_005466 [Trapa incisa]